MDMFKLINTGACSSDMLQNFRYDNKAACEAAYNQVVEYFKKTTFALVSAHNEKVAYEFLLEKGWKDTGYYTGNSDGEMHLLVKGMKLVATEPKIRKVIRKRVKLPLSRVRRKGSVSRNGLGGLDSV